MLAPRRIVLRSCTTTLVAALTIVACVGLPGPAGASLGASAGAVPTPRPSSIRLVSGQHAVTDRAGHVWKPDTASASGGRYVTTSHAISGTNNPRLYRVERTGAIRYRIPVVPGTYHVTLHTAEQYFSHSGRRIFGVTAESKPVRKRVDVFAAVGRFRAYAVGFTIRVPDGVLDIGFIRHRSSAAIATLRVAGLIAYRPKPVRTSTPVASVTPEDFGARGDGVTDDTVALQAAFDNAGGRAVALTAGHTYVHSEVLHLRTAALHVTGPGVLLATAESRSSVWIEADDVLVDGGVEVRTANTTQRWSAWEQMGVRLIGHHGITLQNVTVTGSAAAGIYVGGSAQFVLDHVTVEDTRADGIHMTGGSHDGQVISPTVRNSGDDGVAVVSYSADGPACHDITVSSPRVLGTSGGRGLSVVGGVNVRETDIDVERTAAAGVYIAAEGSPWYSAAPANVTVTGGRIIGADTNTSIDHGAVLILGGEDGPTPTNVTVQDLTVTDTRSSASRDLGVITYGTAPVSVLLADIVVTGGPRSAYQGNTPQSSYRLRSIVQDGVHLPDQG